MGFLLLPISTCAPALTPARTPSPRLRGDSGAVLAEAALLTPIFVTLLFGVLEFGGAFRDYLTLANGALAGTRQAAIRGNAAEADWQVVQAVKKATSAMPLSQLNRVVVYVASGPTAAVPDACKSGSTGIAGVCNVYGPGELAVSSPIVPASWSTCPAAPSQSYPASFFCPTTRNVLAPSSINPGGPDYVGVYTEVTHPWVTGLFGKSIVMSDTSVTRLEPQKL